MYDIPRDKWIVCAICGKKMSDVFIGDGKSHFLKEKFRFHIEKEHGINVETYLEQIGVVTPLCACGCGERVSVNKASGSVMRFSYKVRGHTDTNSESWKKGMARLSESRKGAGNPRFGEKPWNAGLTKETDEIVKLVSEKGKGRITPEETRRKQSESAKLRTVHGHTGKKHSEEIKVFFRNNTLEMIKRGAFSQLVSKPHIAFSLLLDEMGVQYREEQRVGFFSFDFYLTDYNVYVEIDGDYFHSNPIMYPSGPVTKTQKVNYFRDIKKNQFCVDKGLSLVRVWENQIMKQREVVKETIEREILCRKKE